MLSLHPGFYVANIRHLSALVPYPLGVAAAILESPNLTVHLIEAKSAHNLAAREP